MKGFLEKILPWPVIAAYKNYHNKHRADADREKWKSQGKPLPPPHTVKQQAIQHYQRLSGYTTLVETGTYKGDMILAQTGSFETIYSIELSQPLYEKAKKRFQKNPKVHLLQGDSGEVITRVLSDLQKPAIFWLDGHYSGGITATTEKHSPVTDELKALIANNTLQHIILIDDARIFKGEHGYPTIEETKELTQKHFPGYHFSVNEDIIRIVPEKFS